MFEKRGAMTDRIRLVSLPWLTLSLVLLATVTVAPIRTSASVAVPSQPDGLRRAFAPPHSLPTPRLLTPIDADAVPPVNALASENEEQDRADALDEPRISVPIPCCFRKVASLRLMVPRSILSLYPLRC